MDTYPVRYIARGAFSHYRPGNRRRQRLNEVTTTPEPNVEPEVKPLDWRNYISSDPMVCHGKACITGTRVMVTVILDNLADGASVQDIIRSYPSVSPEAVRATLHYAAELARERVSPLAL